MMKRYPRQKETKIVTLKGGRVLFTIVALLVVIAFVPVLYAGKDALSILPEFIFGSNEPETSALSTNDLATSLGNNPENTLASNSPSNLGESVAQRLTQDKKVEQVAEQVNRGVVGRGDTAAALLSDYLTSGEIHAINYESRKIFPLRRIRAGQPFAIALHEDRLERFTYEISPEEKLVVERTPEGFSVSRAPIVYDTAIMRVDGKIQSSLYESIADIGEDPELAVRLAGIFAWEIDFIRDIRNGDSYKALVEKRYRNGKFAGYGKILAAEFVNQKDPYKAFLFKDKHGRQAYYDEKGHNLRKAFLKAPLDFRRVSSGYSNRRLHPILKIWRPHHGIDYAARRGTPVKAVGDGVVTRATRTRAAGKYVTIRHPNGYSSSYLHLNGFARGIKKGVKVSQGKVIGYVGSTGLSTGPHLDFRMKHGKKYVNPRRIKNPSAEPIAKALKGTFRKYVDAYTIGLEQGLAHMPIPNVPKETTL
jgi:murein DD-endopeptidase MepM/ murein hydrolase activator NlpD